MLEGILFGILVELISDLLIFDVLEFVKFTFMLFSIIFIDNNRE